MIGPEALCLNAFRSRYGVQVRTQRFDWGNAWDKLLRIALYGQGPDVSEIGNTWLDSLVEMNALRPLAARELRSLGDQADFLPALWQGIAMLGDRPIWAIPFLADTRVIYYRRHWLKQAGIEDATAFGTPASLVDTLARLQANGFEIPWAMPTRGLEVIYILTSWVWGAGGHFRTPDGRRLRLSELEAQAGMRVHFDLHRFLSPPARALNIAGTDALFRQGKAAAIISGPWLLGLLKQDAARLPDVGVVSVPGVPYAGGTNLVVWRHTRNERAAIRLVQHLTSSRIQRHCFEETHLLPSRVAVLDAEPFVNDPRCQAFAKSLKSGRVLETAYRWAAVEQRLVSALSQLWSDLTEDPQLDLEAEIAERTAVLTEELERTLLATW